MSGMVVSRDSGVITELKIVNVRLFIFVDKLRFVLTEELFDSLYRVEHIDIFGIANDTG